ncbi:hypothetical protein CAP47_02220 [Psychroflexus sp. S27]|uniref:helix-turn-helix domain-containing protein n=1 Tax=Psychroflexus sp. S27 TaxID=1982757 RepID=UPI000C2AC2D7|nr:helix-turn-helix transcriptional regulator [Psychroflexus sp. S27]PJX25137.1 hypothetical protein CAP47_02220 [Psychroflexus sp. S27]
MNLLAKKISEHRKIKGLTQEELAEQAKVNLRTIQRIENSESEPRTQTLQLICDVLEVNVEDILSRDHQRYHKRIGTKIINYFFLIVINMILMGIFGYLTLDSNANPNSVFAAFLLSFLIHFFIVIFTKKMNGFERLLKFGSGYLVYFIIVILSFGFPKGFVSGLFPCLLIGLAILNFGHHFFKSKF